MSISLNTLPYYLYYISYLSNPYCLHFLPCHLPSFESNECFLFTNHETITRQEYVNGNAGRY